jgi:hypothetical protein
MPCYGRATLAPCMHPCCAAPYTRVLPACTLRHARPFSFYSHSRLGRSAAYQLSTSHCTAPCFPSALHRSSLTSPLTHARCRLPCTHAQLAPMPEATHFASATYHCNRCMAALLGIRCPARASLRLHGISFLSTRGPYAWLAYNNAPCDRNLHRSRLTLQQVADRSTTA